LDLALSANAHYGLTGKDEADPEVCRQSFSDMPATPDLSLAKVPKFWDPEAVQQA